MAKVLVVEDDKQLAGVMRDFLSFQNHYVVDVINDGLDAKEALANDSCDLVILDWDLPGMSGVELAKWVRQAKLTTPILMLTGKNTIDEKGVGFASGVDDYLTKPFDMRELSMRAEALLRRSGSSSLQTLVFGNIQMDPAARWVKIDGSKEVELTGTEFSLLEFFMRNPERLFSAEALLQRVWAQDADVTPDLVRVYIKRLREKLQAAGCNQSLKTAHGQGYKLTGA